MDRPEFAQFAHASADYAKNPTRGNFAKLAREQHTIEALRVRILLLRPFALFVAGLLCYGAVRIGLSAWKRRRAALNRSGALFHPML